MAKEKGKANDSKILLNSNYLAMLFVMPHLIKRIHRAIVVLPKQKDWKEGIGLLLFFAVVYLPIGFGLGFLTVEIQSSWPTILGVTIGAFLMPSVIEELGFRALLMPHPNEAISLKNRQIWTIVSWVLFLLYHVHPFVPGFFRTPAFLIGAGLLGMICTISYWRSGSIWMPITLHWLIVIAWLLVFGGLRRF